MLVLLPVLAAAQIELGAVEGIVVDSSGSVVKGASVILTGSIPRTVLTDTNGRFKIPFVDPGVHSLEVSAPGLGTLTRTDIPVEIARTTPLRIELPDEDEAVTLAEETSLADRRLLDTASLMSRRALEGLPVPERAIGVLPLLPGIVPVSYSAAGDPRVTSVRGFEAAAPVVLNGIVLEDGSRVLRESLEQARLITSSGDPLFGSRELELHLVTPAASESFRGSLSASFAPRALRASDDGDIGDILAGAAEAGGGLRDRRVHLWTFIGRERIGGEASAMKTTSALGRIDLGITPATTATVFAGSNERDDRIDSFGSFSGTWTSARASVFARATSMDSASGGVVSASIPFEGARLVHDLRVSGGSDDGSGFAALSDFLAFGSWGVFGSLRWDAASDELQPRALLTRSHGRSLWKASANRYATADSSTDEFQLRVERHVIPELVASLALVRSETENDCGERSADAVEAAAWKRLSNRWMLRGHLTSRMHSDHGGCAGNSASYSYGIDAIVEGPWDVNVGIVVAGADASRESDRSLFQTDLRVSRRWELGDHFVDLSVDALNVSNSDALAFSHRDDEQNARALRVGARFHY